MPRSISLSVNRAAAAMPSLAARSRIPVFVNDSVVPATASRPPVNTADDIASLLCAMSISKPTTVKPTSASSSTTYASKSKLPVTSSATKDCPPLRQHQQGSIAKIAPLINSASVLERIAERRQRVIANLAPGSKIAPSVNRASVHDRIAERRQRAIANLAPGLSRPTPPVTVTPTSTSKSSSTSSRVPSLTPITAAPASTSEPSSTPLAVAVPEPVIPAAVPAPRKYGWLSIQMPYNYRQGTDGKYAHIDNIVQISDRVWNADSLIPSASTGRKPRTRLPGRFRPATIPLTRTRIPDQLSAVFLPHTISQFPRHYSPVYLSRRPDSDKIRGTSDYCEARPRIPKPRGNCGYGLLRKGRTCKCCEDDGEIPLRYYNIPPNQWATTPAESGVDPHPPRIRTDRPRKHARFAEDLVHTFQGLKDPDSVFDCEPMSNDPTTRAEDFPEGFPLYEDDGPRKRILRRR